MRVWSREKAATQTQSERVRSRVKKYGENMKRQRDATERLLENQTKELLWKAKGSSRISI